MMITSRHRGIAARAVLASWAFLGAAASPAEGSHRHVSEGHSAPTEAIRALPTAASGAECPAQISCGDGCVAEYATGFCTATIEYEARLGLGGLTIGPSFKIECGYCDCWYLMPGPNGTLLMRHYELTCGASFPGLEYE